MKTIFIKILASASLLLGLLGPQVASGSNVTVASPQINQDPIEVVSSSTQVDVVVAPASDSSLCGFSGLSLDRIDWLIWQACDSLQVQTQTQTQSLQVVSSPTEVPTVEVASIPVQDLYTPDGLSPIQGSNNLPAIPQVMVLMTGRLKSEAGVRGNLTNFSTYDYHADRQNTFTTISMRC